LSDVQPLQPAVPLDVARRLWSRFQARDWAAACRLLHDDLQATWWATGERYLGADAFIEANARYPEGWTIFVIDISLLHDGRVLSIVRVDHPPQRFFTTSLCRVDEHGLIVDIEEYWATVEEPPDWRSPARLAGCVRFDPASDPRARCA
jgi:hypothetical protein